MSIDYSVTKKIELPDHTEKSRVHDAVLGTCENGDSLMYVKSRANGRVLSLVRNTADYKKNIALNVPMNPNVGQMLTDCEREYLRSGSIFNTRLITLGGTTLHGSCIAYKGEGIVFSAPSGTGKSTHTSLWKKLFKDDVVFVNDDKPAIVPTSDGVFAYGTPWSGKTDLNTNIKVPLKAVVFVVRAEENSLKRLSVAEAVCYLNDQTFPPFYDKGLYVKNIDVIEEIIKKVPIWQLNCNMEDDAAILVRDTIFNGKDC